MFRCSRKFSVGKTQKVVFHLLSNRISQKIIANGKQPLSPPHPLSLYRPPAVFRTSFPIRFFNILEPGIGCSRSKISLFYYSSTKKSLFNRSEKSAVSITHHNDDGKKGVHVPLPKGHSQAIC